VTNSYFSKDKVGDGSLRIERGNDLKGVEVAPGVTLHPLIGDGMNINVVVIEPNGVAELHAHDEEQMGYVVSGACEFTDGQNTWTLEPGDLYHARANVPHGARSLGDRCVIIDCFSPERAGIRELLEG
jgi:quercetin dioxygenase-like cupin family protein